MVASAGAHACTYTRARWRVARGGQRGGSSSDAHSHLCLCGASVLGRTYGRACALDYAYGGQYMPSSWYSVYEVWRFGDGAVSRDRSSRAFVCLFFSWGRTARHCFATMVCECKLQRQSRVRRAERGHTGRGTVRCGILTFCREWFVRERLLSGCNYSIRG